MAKTKKSFDYEDPFPKRFRKLIEKKGATLDSLATEFHTTRQTVSNWQNGATVPDAISICEIAKYFGVTTDYLLGLTDSKSPEITKRAITDATGLSDDAVDALCKRKRFEDERSKFHLAKYSTDDPFAMRARNEDSIVSKIISDGTIFKLAEIIREAFEINQIIKEQTDVFASKADAEKIVALRHNDDFLKRLAPFFCSYGYDNSADRFVDRDCLNEDDYTALAEREFESFKVSRAHFTDAQFVRDLYSTKERYKEDLSYRKFESYSIVHDFVERFLNKQPLPDDSYIFMDYFDQHEDEDKEMEAATSCNVDEK